MSLLTKVTIEAWGKNKKVAIEFARAILDDLSCTTSVPFGVSGGGINGNASGEIMEVESDVDEETLEDSGGL